MNTAQERHTKSMARKIRGWAESIVRSMEAIEREALGDIPLPVIEAKFNEVPGDLENIQGVLDDMLPELAEQ